MFEDDEDDFGIIYKSGSRYTTSLKKPTHKKGKTMSKQELYEIPANELNPFDHTSKFAIKLAENSAGKWVMEIKGTGEVVAIDPSKVVKVIPYTIGIKFQPNGTIYHYRAKSGQYQVGDFCIVSSAITDGFSIVQIVEVDSKSDRATKDFEPLKVFK